MGIDAYACWNSSGIDGQLEPSGDQSSGVVF
jgi:hypothetical protein